MNKKVLILIIAILIIIGGIFIIKWANSPTKPINIEPIAASPTPLPDPIVLQNIWFKTKIPAGFKQSSYQEDVNSNIKLQAVFIGDSKKYGQIAITLRDLPSDGITGAAEYNMRIKDPVKYQAVAYGGWPEAAKTFSMTSGFETTSFWVNKNLYATVSASGDDSVNKETSIALSAVLDQWQWY